MKDLTDFESDGIIKRQTAVMRQGSRFQTEDLVFLNLSKASSMTERCTPRENKIF